jgi:sulfite dehydrogenase (cytochrome) subunit B
LTVSMKRASKIWILAIGFAAAAGSFANTLRIDLPEETARLKPGPGADMANGHCLICHSAEYITTQPRDKPLAFWKAEVEKMKKVYGAPIPDDQIDSLAEYLSRSYGTGAP